jgi:hypothetical protein
MKGASSKKDPKFPEKLHYVLSEIEKDGLQHIASLQPHGRCLVVHDQEELSMPNLKRNNWK